MAKHLIYESNTFTGEWNIPEPEFATVSPISGTLTWDSEKAVLDLNDTFKPMQGAIYGDEIQRYSAVHGETTDSKFVTVLNAYGGVNSLSFGPAGVRQRQTLHSGWLVVGAHVDPQTKYSEILVRIPGLQIWLGATGVEQTIFGKSATSPLKVVYTIEGVSEEIFEVSSLPGTLSWVIGREFSGDLVSEINVRTSAHLRIRCASGQDLDWFFAQLGKATTLLALITGSPMAPDHVSAKIADGGVAVEILVALQGATRCEHRTHHDFHMLRGSMGVESGSLLSSWYEKYETIAMPSQLALSVLSSKDLWLHVEFLSLMQALEGFHRSIMSGLYTSDENYEEVRKSLSQAIPKQVTPDHREALKSRIKYGNEISLRKRLEKLVDRLGLPIRRYILGGDGTVPRSWIETRNYYTHWDEASKNRILDNLEMHRANVRLRHLLRALYLDFAGIPQSAIARSLTNTSKESQDLIQLNNSELRRQNPENKGVPIMNISAKESQKPDKEIE